MSRCWDTTKLEIHHINRGAGDVLSNAMVLCHACHSKTETYGKHGNSPPPFSQKTKDEALERAGYKCECSKGKECH